MRLIHERLAGIPLTYVHLVFPHAGACLDPAGLQGLTRTMLRLMFAGARGLSNAELNGRLERLGASMGFSQHNDHLALRLVTLTENLDAAVDLFLAALHEPNLDGEEFARLKADALSSWQADREESKAIKAQEVYLHELYRGGPQGYQPDGTLDGLGAMKLAAVQEQYRAVFGQAEPFLAVLSDLSREEIGSRLAPRIAPPPGKALPDPWAAFDPVRATGRRIVLLPEAGTETDEIVVGGFSARETAPDWHVHRLITLLFGGDMNSRLFRVLRGEHGLSYGASSWYEAQHGQCPRDQVSPFTLYTFPSAEHTAQALPLLLSLYEDLVERGFTADEMQRGRDTLIHSHPFLRDTPQKKLALQVQEALYGIRVDEEPEYRAKLEATTGADVLRVLRATHDPRRVLIVLLGNPGRLEPLARAIPDTEDFRVVEYPKAT
jgi:zinc protease